MADHRHPLGSFEHMLAAAAKGDVAEVVNCLRYAGRAGNLEEQAAGLVRQYG